MRFLCFLAVWISIHFLAISSSLADDFKMPDAHAIEGFEKYQTMPGRSIPYLGNEPSFGSLPSAKSEVENWDLPKFKPEMQIEDIVRGLWDLHGYCDHAICGTDPTGGIPGGIDPSNPNGNFVNLLRKMSLGTVKAEPKKKKNGFPTVVALLDNHGATRCSGVMLNEGFILTAAHCVCTIQLDLAWVGNSTFIESQQGFNQGFELSSKISLFQDDYCKSDVEKLRDIALIQLQDPHAIVNSFFLESLPERIVQGDDFFAYIVGFGVGSTDATAGTKRDGVISLSPCTTSLSKLEDCRPNFEFIAVEKGRGNIDTCKGDSGGPAYRHNADGSLTLVAITSRKRARGDAEHCGSGGIYTILTPNVLAWIKSHFKD